MSYKLAFMMAAMSPKENQPEVLNAAFAAGLRMSERNRTMFNVTQANLQADNHRREVASAERTIGNQVLAAVADITQKGLDPDTDEFRKRYTKLDSLGLLPRLGELLNPDRIPVIDD